MNKPRQTSREVPLNILKIEQLVVIVIKCIANIHVKNNNNAV